MKLKKIASLALAGIMAVSMLAGCNGSSNNGTNPPASSTPTTSSLVNDVEDAIKDINPTLTISVNESTQLAKRIQQAEDLYTSVGIDSETVRKLVADTFNIDVADYWTISAANTYGSNVTESVNYSGRKAPDTTWYAEVYEFGDCTAAACREQALNSIANDFDGMKNEFVNGDNDKLQNTYTMYVYEGKVTTGTNKVIPYVIAVLKCDTSATV